MFKKIPVALLISFSASSFAYQVKANLTIDNKTEIPMQIIVTQPNNQPDIIQDIPAKHITRVSKSQDEFGDPLDNGELGQLKAPKDWASHASFIIKGIKDDQKVYLQGRVNYYSSAIVSSKYSFLDAITPADGLKFDPKYTCHSGGSNPTFDNQIVIEGTPGNTLKPTAFPTENASCQGLKSSSQQDQGQYYKPVCFDGDGPVYVRGLGGVSKTGRLAIGYRRYDLPLQSTWFFIVNESIEGSELQGVLDTQIGNWYCGTW